MNKQSNSYTFVYSIVLVLIVGVALSLIYQSLRPKQMENEADDTRRQILAAALLSPHDNETIGEMYGKYIIDSFFVNTLGDRVKESVTPFETDIAAESKKAAGDRLLPVFVCRLPGGIKYIIPVYGAGLWGPIWGYIAFDSDGNTIYGAYFAHQGETPGLGAEIEKEPFRKQFEGKSVFEDGHFTSVEVVKNGHEPSDRAWVHAVSGGTVTSTGVQKMLYESLQPYEAFLKKLQAEKR